MLNESFKNSKEKYNKALKLYRDLTDSWHELTSGAARDVEYKVNTTMQKLDDFSKLVNAVDLDDLQANLPEKKMRKVRHNMRIFREAAYYIYRNLKRIDYADDLRPAADKFVENLGLTDSQLRKWGGSVEEVAKRFVSTITHPDNVLDYENEIKRMSKGKMSPTEFYRIFDTLKPQMTTVKTKPKKKREFPPKSEKPPEMWSKEKRRDFEERSEERWSSVEKGREETAEELDISTEPPEEFEKDDKNYLRTPDGEVRPYFTMVKDKQGVVHYLNSDDEIVYSYVSEGFLPISTYVKLIRS